jgi:hypothetical protein
VFDAAIYVSKITEIPGDSYYISGAARKILVVPRATLLIWILASNNAMLKIHLSRSVVLQWLGCRSDEQSIDPRQSPSTWRHAANDFYQVVPRAG